MRCSCGAPLRARSVGTLAQRIVDKVKAGHLGKAHAGELAAALAVAAGTMLGLYQKGNRVSLPSVVEDYANLYVQHALDAALARRVTLRRARAD